MDIPGATTQLLEVFRDSKIPELLNDVHHWNSAEVRDIGQISSLLVGAFLDEGLNRGQQAQQVSDWKKHVEELLEDNRDAELYSHRSSFSKAHILRGIHHGLDMVTRERYEAARGTTGKSKNTKVSKPA